MEKGRPGHRADLGTTGLIRMKSDKAFQLGEKV